MAEFDLTQTIIPYYDRHLVFPLLAHLAGSGIFPEEQVQAAQYELAKGTNMVDYAVSLFTPLYAEQEVPSGAFITLPYRVLLSGCLQDPFYAEILEISRIRRKT